MSKELIQNLRSVGRLWEDEAADLIERLAIENENLLLANRDCLDHFNVMKDDLAAAQAQTKVLREALEAVRDQRIEGYVFPAVVDLNAWHSKVIDALATPPDDSALRELLKAERERCAKVADEWQTAIHDPRYQCDCAAAIRKLGEQE